ncbi:Prolyl tripeptidyl peptidase precursor [Luteitalea pratensis]|uniref:Prolyl tripeptidyl peptidase n=1 Tax=Luteitalea pratensis TaxID=1855912 RepID=A0A143PUF8_LUTPR|nr:prolyl oligopeptidase family serine peptidase [Luteitalea pratensis]AMY12295.1 Prolyl tripeptidyl peptidase precursor [Luteitalea pratensis]
MQRTLSFLLWSGVAVAVMSGMALAQPAGQPPLIDRALFFGDPEISGSQLSPDGQYLSFIKPFNGTRNIWVKKADEPFANARAITNDQKRPIANYFWSRDSRYVLYSQDQGGDENFNVYAVDPKAAPAAGQPVPVARNLTDAKGVRALIYSVPKSDPDVMYVGINERDKAWHDLYKVKISTGERTLVRENKDKVAGWVFDEAGQLRLGARTTDNGSTEILRVDKDALVKVYECNVFETCQPIRFHKDATQAYLITNKGDVDLIGLVLFDPSSSKTTLVESDPKRRVDLGNAVFSDKTGDLLATQYEDERVRWYVKEPSFKADFDFIEKRFPGKDVNFQSSTADEQRWIVVVASDTDPGEVFVYDRATRKVTPQYKVRETLPRDQLAPMTTLTYPSSDGLQIPAYLTLPRGIPAKALPLMVVPHGGPWGRDTWGYDTFAQFLANRGYAVLQPNFRASTGYGKKFLNLGNGKWGETMQDDITWGVKHLVAQGTVDPKRVGIMGGSYGGYATLAGVAFTPDLYSAGVAIVAPSNLLTLLDSIPPYWESIRTVFNVRMGDPGKADDKARLMKQSPLNSADRIHTPLMVVQGQNDPRVKRAESDQIVIALRDRGFPVEYLVAPDEGHGFARPVNNMAMIASTEKFLARHLGGRFQEEMPADVATRLKEITVDPKTVTLTAAATAAAGAPKPAADLAPMKATYSASIAMGGQSMAMKIAQEAREENGTWVFTETADTPMGAATDSAVIEKGTLLIKKRTVKQGPADIALDFSDKAITGTLAMNGQSRPVNVALDGPVFADGPGSHAVIAHLPLAQGYTTSFRNLDLRSQKVEVKQLAVVGRESVTVPAGTFDAWKVEVKGADGGVTTLWVAADSRQVAKISATLPAMNGAVLTAELEK